MYLIFGGAAACLAQAVFGRFGGGGFGGSRVIFGKPPLGVGAAPSISGAGGASILLNRVWRRPFLAVLAGADSVEACEFWEGAGALVSWERGTSSQKKQQSTRWFILCPSQLAYEDRRSSDLPGVRQGDPRKKITINRVVYAFSPTELGAGVRGPTELGSP